MGFYLLSTKYHHLLPIIYMLLRQQISLTGIAKARRNHDFSDQFPRTPIIKTWSSSQGISYSKLAPSAATTSSQKFFVFPITAISTLMSLSFCYRRISCMTRIRDGLMVGVQGAAVFSWRTQRGKTGHRITVEWMDYHKSWRNIW